MKLISAFTYSSFLLYTLILLGKDKVKEEVKEEVKRDMKRSEKRNTNGSEEKASLSKH